MRQYQSATVTVFCHGCGAPRVLTRRQERRAGLCRECLYGPKDMPVSDRHRAWWFKQFNDSQLSDLASELAGRVVPTARIAERRAALIAAGSLQGVESVGEREPSRALLSPPR